MNRPSVSPTVRLVPLSILLLGPVLLFAACGGDDYDVGEMAPMIRQVLTAGDAPVLPLATGDTVHLGAEVQDFYRTRDYQPAWTGGNGVTERGDSLLAVIRRSDEEGFDPSAYHVAAVDNLLERIRSGSEEGFSVGEELGQLDLLLTETFLRFAGDLARGRLDPEAGGRPWNIDRGPPPDAALLRSLLEEESLGTVMDSLRPSVAHYDRLREALARYRAVAREGGWPEIAGGEAPEVGRADGRVTSLRRRLALEGDPVEERLVRQDSADARGVYTESLARAVEHFQMRHGLEADGVLGASTIEALNVPVEERVLDIQLNLDRWRWLPRDLGRRYILVNVAGFEMAVMEEDRPVLSMNVVVGKTAWQTPIFQDTMEHIVFNPYWNVPPSIEREEILPAVRNDPSYLARNHFEVVSSSGDVVGPSAFASTPPGQASSYRVRQTPGPWNALGQVKFMFPNDDNIYLHDTPAENLFSQRSRAFSHGCIRVERPMELARYLLENTTERPASDVEELLAGGEERYVNLDEHVPVYILYFTAWTDEGGSVRFHQDIYDRNAEVAEEARAKLSPGGDRPLG